MVDWHQIESESRPGKEGYGHIKLCSLLPVNFTEQWKVRSYGTDNDICIVVI